jgi:hypothetical protein
MVCYVNFLSATSPNTMDGSPARSIALIHQLHDAGEEGGSATMVAVFLPVLPVGVVLCFSSRDVTRSTYVAVGTKKNKGGAGAGVRYVTLCPTLACTTPRVIFKNFQIFSVIFLNPPTVLLKEKSTYVQ